MKNYKMGTCTECNKRRRIERLKEIIQPHKRPLKIRLVCTFCLGLEKEYDRKNKKS
jgi:hypothetical protein